MVFSSLRLNSNVASGEKKHLRSSQEGGRTKSSVFLHVIRLRKNPAAPLAARRDSYRRSFIDQELTNWLLWGFLSGSKESFFFIFFYEVIIFIHAFWAALQRRPTWNRTLMGFKLRYIKENWGKCIANEGVWRVKEVIKSGWKGRFRDNALWGGFWKEVKEICDFSFSPHCWSRLKGM